jgi:hypothetical protein
MAKKNKIPGEKKRLREEKRAARDAAKADRKRAATATLAEAEAPSVVEVEAAPVVEAKAAPVVDAIVAPTPEAAATSPAKVAATKALKVAAAKLPSLAGSVSTDASLPTAPVTHRVVEEAPVAKPAVAPKASDRAPAKAPVAKAKAPVATPPPAKLAVPAERTAPRLPTDRAGLLELHRDLRHRRDALPLLSEQRAETVIELARVEVQVARIERAMDPPLG